jgi:hypothetical protein
MRRLIIIFGAIFASALCSLPAHACRIYRPPSQRISSVYVNYTDIQVATVEIIAAQHLTSAVVRGIQARYPDYKPWRVAARVTEMISGDASPELVVFDRGQSSCDDGTKIPHEGEKWVIYYKPNHLGQADEIVESYPLAVAIAADPRVRANGS